MKQNAFFFAMADEVQAFLDAHSKALKPIVHDVFTLYEWEDNIVAITGIGLINAAMCATYVATYYDIARFVNIGLAGAVNKNLKVLDVVLIASAVHGATDATAFGYEFGQTPKEPPRYDATAKLTKKLSSRYGGHQGTLGSSDVFVNNEAKLVTYFGGFAIMPDILDMEGYSIFQVANKFKLEMCCLKIVSDILGHENANETQFLQILHDGAYLIEKIMVEYQEWGL